MFLDFFSDSILLHCILFSRAKSFKWVQSRHLSSLCSCSILVHSIFPGKVWSIMCRWNFVNIISILRLVHVRRVTSVRLLEKTRGIYIKNTKGSTFNVTRTYNKKVKTILVVTFFFFNVDHTNNNNLLLYVTIFTYISTWCYDSIF